MKNIPVEMIVFNDDIEGMSCAGIDSSWPPRDCVAKLIEASNILLNDKNYDGHGYEEICAARDAAKKFYGIR